MDLTKTEWEIVKCFSKGDRTPTQLAKSLNMTLPSIHRQLKTLESKNIIKKMKTLGGKTRPFTSYSMGEGFVYFIKAFKGSAEKKFLSLNKNLELHLNIWSVPQQDYHEAIESYWWKKIKPILNKIDALAIFGSVARGDATPDSDIDVLIISNKKISLKAAMAEKKIFVPQIYSLKDIQEAIREKSKFMSEIKKDIIQIYDPNGALDEIKG